jgi:Na+-translocating ferredoxin:NAD+ oxidoreductase RnfD subunit
VKSVRAALVALIAVLCLQLLVAVAIAPLLPWLLIGLMLTGVFGVIVRRGG